MKKKLSLMLLLLCVPLLVSCGKEKKGEASPLPAPPIVTPAPDAPEPTVTPAEYDTIAKADQSLVKQVKEELMSAAEVCRGLYAEADKGSTLNVVLPEATVYDMVRLLGSYGYPTVDSEGKWDMAGAGTLMDFGESVRLGLDCAATYYTVYPDGQISAFHLRREKGEWSLISMSAAWDQNGEPKQITKGQYQIGDVKYTDKGWLIYDRNYSSFDENQRSNSNSYVFIRVKPTDGVMRELCEKYVKPIGYFENNLFTVSWTQFDPSPVDFNSLYSSLFAMYYGGEKLSSYNAEQTFSHVEGSSLFLIPAESFEEPVKYYFDLDPSYLRGIAEYSSAAGGYFFLGYQNGLYNVTPRTPEPEVVDYHYNSDGSVTMRIDAVNKWYGTDRAFTHELTVYEYESGRIKYISNKLIESDTNILPENRLSYLLHTERKKTPY